MSADTRPRPGGVTPELAERLRHIEAIGHELRQALTPVLLRDPGPLDTASDAASIGHARELRERSLARCLLLLDELDREARGASQLAAGDPAGRQRRLA